MTPQPLSGSAGARTPSASTPLQQLLPLAFANPAVLLPSAVGFRVELVNVSLVLPSCELLASLRARVCYERPPGTIQVWGAARDRRGPSRCGVRRVPARAHAALAAMTKVGLGGWRDVRAACAAYQ